MGKKCVESCYIPWCRAEMRKCSERERRRATQGQTLPALFSGPRGMWTCGPRCHFGQRRSNRNIAQDDCCCSNRSVFVEWRFIHVHAPRVWVKPAKLIWGKGDSKLGIRLPLSSPRAQSLPFFWTLQSCSSIFVCRYRDLWCPQATPTQLWSLDHISEISISFHLAKSVPIISLIFWISTSFKPPPWGGRDRNGSEVALWPGW